jgi:hypothetical protein
MVKVNLTQNPKILPPPAKSNPELKQMSMSKKGHSEEQIVAALQQAETGEKVGRYLPESVDQPSHLLRWKKDYAGLRIIALRSRGS